LNCLVTGASGFIGPYLIDDLKAQGYRVRCLVRSAAQAAEWESKDVEAIIGDVTDAQSLEGIAAGIDCLFHLATLGHMNNFTVTEAMFEAVNVEGTRNVMNEALGSGVKRVIHCSSVAAMGICPEMPADENSTCRPHHAYGRSKLEAEKLVGKLVAQKGLPAVILRFSMVYGPRDWRDMLKLARMAKRGFFPKIGKRPKLTPLIHVKDAVKALLLAAAKGRVGETYLITNAQSEPFDRLIETIEQTLGHKTRTLFIPESVALLAASIIEKSFVMIGKAPPVARKNIESTLADRIFSIQKAQRELGFEPQTDPYQGIEETVRWYQENNWV
jgi:nucleoside-diphosphate-sugar epimerase